MVVKEMAATTRVEEYADVLFKRIKATRSRSNFDVDIVVDSFASKKKESVYNKSFEAVFTFSGLSKQATECSSAMRAITSVNSCIVKYDI